MELQFLIHGEGPPHRLECRPDSRSMSWRGIQLGSGFPITRFEHGFHSIIMENGIPIMESMTTNEIGEISVIYPIESESIDLGLY